MDLDDTLRDRLSAAATATRTRPLPAAATVRRTAERHRAQRRGGAAAVLVAAAAVAVALGSTLGPQLLSAPPAVDPSPTVTEQAPPPTTPVPSPTQAPDRTEPEAPPEQQVTQEEARGFVEAFRFEDEEALAADPDFPATADTSFTGVVAFGCPEQVRIPGPLAVRTVVYADPEVTTSRVLAVFESSAAARQGFAELRSAMRACHAEPRRFDDGVHVTETTYVGGQLALGDESFWVGGRDVVVESDDAQSVGAETPWSSAELFVLDGTTITVIEGPAASDDSRAQFVEAATAEWERLRSRLDAVMPE